MELPKTYNPKDNESKWQKLWEEWGIYRFNFKDETKPTYAIDTPPPYPSGEFHMGNALNWCYFDFIARYKRMKGFNVHFPQGWDCHGLPTEVRAETKFKVRKKDLSINEFRKLCIQLTLEYINEMKTTMKKIGYSIDWFLEYKTMDPEYYKLTQLSFILLYKKGKLYRGEHPVNWCPRCETAIAEAEVEYIERETILNYIKFKLIDEAEKDLLIATTRPELISACVAVAVNPNDERYLNIIGKFVEIPLFNKKVKIISDDEVDPKFGTGVVMICTYGDKTDVKWQKRHNLPQIIVITEDGKMNEKAGKYAGLFIHECKKAIIEDLEKENLIVKKEFLKQSVGTCWRCHTPVEILSKPQWFMKTREMTDEVIKWTEKVEWIPSFAKKRMIDWALSLDWDWVISRQRMFATPIPVWYCVKCKEIIVAEKEWLPIDPRFEKPKISSCPKCGSNEFTGEIDVMDTWMDSSITCAVHAGWPNNPKTFKKLFPADLQPNGLDIIRTWDYYLMVKHLALFNIAPYKTVLINGMVRGSDGRMMHKSYGNYVEANAVIEKYGADALRQWAAGGGSTGYDVPFRWSDVEYGKRFLTKLWNASRFILMNLNNFKMEDKQYKLEVLDKWLLSKLEKLTEEVTNALENFQFNIAIEAIRNFTWHIFCDHYLEAVKLRLKLPKDSLSKEAAQYTLVYTLYRIIQLLAPICPHITETIYQIIKPIVNGKSEQSIHLTKWPSQNKNLISNEDEKLGDLIVNVIATIRRLKAEKKVSLKTPLSKAIIYVKEKEALSKYLDLIAQTCIINFIEVKSLIDEEDIKVEVTL
ncbi:valine--tRNA ligase [Candidatus Bathyarchaeota archaeon]|nr:valine--tRNA ligase [Candidatus Bathyarchaeota archaeon]